MIRYNNRAVVEFGNGTVLLVPRLTVEGIGLLGLDMCEPHEIGNFVEFNEPYDINTCPIVLAFHKIESLDVVIEDLKRIRDGMVAFENGEFKE